MNKHFALLGITGVVLSAGTIVAMAAGRTDGYSHLTKAVSELGSTDAPHREIFNLFGYILPGLLIASFAYGLNVALGAGDGHWQRPLVLLAASGLLMALAGLCPMDMAHRTAPVSLLHTMGSLGSGLAWLLCASTIGRLLRAHATWANLARPLALLTWTAAPFIVLIPMLSPATPALGQRVSFTAYFLFVALLAVRLYRLDSNAKPSLHQ